MSSGAAVLRRIARASLPIAATIDAGAKRANGGDASAGKRHGGDKYTERAALYARLHVGTRVVVQSGPAEGMQLIVTRRGTPPADANQPAFVPQLGLHSRVREPASNHYEFVVAAGGKLLADADSDARFEPLRAWLAGIVEAAQPVNAHDLAQRFAAVNAPFAVRYDNVAILDVASVCSGDPPPGAVCIDASFGEPASCWHVCKLDGAALYVRAGTGATLPVVSELRWLVYPCLSALQGIVRGQLPLQRVEQSQSLAENTIVHMMCECVAAGGLVYNAREHRTQHATMHLARRAGIIGVEDGWAREHAEGIVSCLALALLHSQSSTYVATAWAVNAIGNMLVAARGSPARVQYDWLTDKQWTQAHAIVQALGAMPGDLQMFADMRDLRDAARDDSAWRDNSALVETAWRESDVPLATPNDYLAFTHNYHVLNTAVLCIPPPERLRRGVYAPLDAYAELWDTYTGVNARNRSQAACARFRSRLVQWMRLSYQLHRAVHDASVPARARLPVIGAAPRPAIAGYGTDDLAAVLAVGPVLVDASGGRRAVVVTVGAGQIPETVAVRVARGKSTVGDSPTDDERAHALDVVRAAPHKFATQFMRGTVRYESAVSRWVVERELAPAAPRHEPLDAVPAWECVADSPIGDGVRANAAQLLGELLHTTSGMHVVVRYVQRLLRGATDTVAVPAPQRSGEAAGVHPYAGNAYRMCCVLCQLYPGALRPHGPGRFTVPSAVALQELRMDIDSALEAIDESADASQPADQAPRHFDPTQPLSAPSVSAAQVTEQRRVANAVLARVAETGVGLFSAAMGFGKTFVAGDILRTLLDGSSVAIYATINGEAVAESARLLIAQGFNVLVVKATSDLHKALLGDAATRAVLVCTHDILATYALRADGPSFGNTLCLVLDEIHAAYNAETRRMEGLLSAAMAARYVVGMSGTFVSVKPGLREWLALAIDAPITTTNVLAAAALVPWAAYTPPRTVHAQVITVPLDSSVAQLIAANAQAGQPDPASWNRIADATYDVLVSRVVAEALRALDKGNGAGVVVVAHTHAYADTLLAALNAVRSGVAARVAQYADPGTPIVVALLTAHSHGINWMTRCYAYVLPVLPASDVTLRQLEARFNRPGQQRDVLRVEVSMDGMFEALRLRHSSAIARASAVDWAGLYAAAQRVTQST